jgi:hypothetical protein
MTKDMNAIIKDMRISVMERCAERIAKGEKIPVHDCSPGLTFRTKNKYL